MADEEQLAELKKKRSFKKFTFRGLDLDQLLDMNK
jgi:small subunit ribosomal protein S15e